jgi:hypothetical protein
MIDDRVAGNSREGIGLALVRHHLQDQSHHCEDDQVMEIMKDEGTLLALDVTSLQEGRLHHLVEIPRPLEKADITIRQRGLISQDIPRQGSFADTNDSNLLSSLKLMLSPLVINYKQRRIVMISYT